MGDVFGGVIVRCVFHPEKEAIVVCVSCHIPLCEACKVKSNGKNFCFKCASKTENLDLDSEIEDLANLPGDIFKSFIKANDFLKEKGIHTDVNNLKDKSSDALKSLSEEVHVNTDRFLEKSSNAYKHLSEDDSNSSLSGNNKQKDSKHLKLSKNLFDDLKKAKELLDMGAITPEEYDQLKHEILK